MIIEKQYIVLALICLAIHIIFAFTLPHLKIFKPTREHAQQLFVLTYTPRCSNRHFAWVCHFRLCQTYRKPVGGT